MTKQKKIEKYPILKAIRRAIWNILTWHPKIEGHSIPEDEENEDSQGDGLMTMDDEDDIMFPEE